jgi:DMSO/TMAO reductase YedYZ molybdopterin-dependent catalytic subunit
MKSNLRRRTLRSFAVLLVGFGIGIAGWTLVLHSRPIEGTPGVFRHILDLNGRIWQSFYRESRTNKSGPVPPGKMPRVNGDIGMDEDIDLEHWRLAVRVGENASDKPLSVAMDQIRALPRTETSAQFRCIEGWHDDITYAGVRFSDFLNYYHLGRRPDGKWFKYVGLETPDGQYYVSIDIESMLHPQTVLAYEMNGQVLDDENGAPLRLIIPVKYGIKSIKRIGRIFFSDVRPRDYWEEQGYDWFAGL